MTTAEKQMALDELDYWIDKLKRESFKLILINPEIQRTLVELTLEKTRILTLP